MAVTAALPPLLVCDFVEPSSTSTASAVGRSTPRRSARATPPDLSDPARGRGRRVAAPAAPAARRRPTMSCGRRVCCAGSRVELPGPRLLASCYDVSLLGVPFYVMEFLDELRRRLRRRRTSRPRPPQRDGAPDHLGARDAARPRPQATTSATLGGPTTTSAPGAPLRRAVGARRHARAAGLDELPSGWVRTCPRAGRGDRARRLPDRQPPFSRIRPCASGIVDREMATLGDPLPTSASCVPISPSAVTAATS